MKLKDAIAEIIKQRNDKAKAFAQKKAAYASIRERVDNILKARNAINSDDREVIEILGQDFLDAISAINPDAFFKKYEELTKLLDTVHARYQKEEINISVVGFARQGKSRLLQSISGLDNRIIPAFDTSDCTGAVSVIRNVDGATLSARVYFYSAAQMIEIINKYIANIGRGIIAEVKTLEDIAKIDVEKLKAVIAAEQSFDSEKCEQLAKYVENYEVWSKHIIRYGNTGEFMELYDPNEIMKYVAQYNGEPISSAKRENYYNYLAVSKVEISCQFNYKDAGKIVLRDTIGLGDAKMIGLTDSMLNSVAGDCDAAIVIKRPKDRTDNIREEDTRLYDTLKKSCEKRGLAMEQWFFYVINHMTGAADNMDACLAVNEQLKGKAAAGTYIADVSNVDEVTKKIIIPMLEKLKDNLPSLDKDLEDRVAAKANEVYEEYEKLFYMCQRANSLCNINDNWRYRLTDMFDTMWVDVNADLNAIWTVYHNNSTEESAEFEQAVRALAPKVGTSASLVPSEEEIYNALNAGGASSAATVLTVYYLHKLRNDFTKEFVNMDEIMNGLVYKLQREICGILIKDFKFDRLVGYTADQLGERLKAEYVAERKAKNLLDAEDLSGYSDGEKYAKWLTEVYLTLSENFKGVEYADIILAIKFIAEFNISVRSFLMHRVRSGIDMLDPDINGAPVALINSMLSGSLQQKAHTMQEILIDAYIESYDRVKTSVEKMFKEPNQLLYSAVAEFRDRMFYSFSSRKGRLMDVKETWRNIYRDGVDIFNRNLAQASESAKKLQREFNEMASSKLTREEFFNIK